MIEAGLRRFVHLWIVAHDRFGTLDRSNRATNQPSGIFNRDAGWQTANWRFANFRVLIAPPPAVLHVCQLGCERCTLCCGQVTALDIGARYIHGTQNPEIDRKPA